jgi:hypothetical protein
VLGEATSMGMHARRSNCNSSVFWWHDDYVNMYGQPQRMGAFCHGLSVHPVVDWWLI